MLITHDNGYIFNPQHGMFPATYCMNGIPTSFIKSTSTYKSILNSAYKQIFHALLPDKCDPFMFVSRKLSCN